MFAPGDITEAVSPIVIAFLETLLMETGAIETYGLSKLDISA